MDVEFFLSGVLQENQAGRIELVCSGVSANVISLELPFDIDASLFIGKRVHVLPCSSLLSPTLSSKIALKDIPPPYTEVAAIQLETEMDLDEEENEEENEEKSIDELFGNHSSSSSSSSVTDNQESGIASFHGKVTAVSPVIKKMPNICCFFVELSSQNKSIVIVFNGLELVGFHENGILRVGRFIKIKDAHCSWFSCCGMNEKKKVFVVSSLIQKVIAFKQTQQEEKQRTTESCFVEKIPLTQERPNSNKQDLPQICNFTGKITARPFDCLIILDDFVPLFLTHFNPTNFGRGWRIGSVICIHNAHILRDSENHFRGLGLCFYSSVDILNFTEYASALFIPVLHVCCPIYQATKGMSLPDVVWFFGTLKEFSQIWPECSTKELTEMTLKLAEKIGIQCKRKRNVFLQFFSHHSGIKCDLLSNNIVRNPENIIQIKQISSASTWTFERPIAGTVRKTGSRIILQSGIERVFIDQSDISLEDIGKRFLFKRFDLLIQEPELVIKVSMKNSICFDSNIQYPHSTLLIKIPKMPKRTCFIIRCSVSSVVCLSLDYNRETAQRSVRATFIADDGSSEVALFCKGQEVWKILCIDNSYLNIIDQLCSMHGSFNWPRPSFSLERQDPFKSFTQLIQSSLWKLQFIMSCEQSGDMAEMLDGSFKPLLKVISVNPVNNVTQTIQLISEIKSIS